MDLGGKNMLRILLRNIKTMIDRALARGEASCDPRFAKKKG